MNIIKTFEAALDRMNKRGWDFIYVLVDLHGTVFLPSYNEKEEFILYPYAAETLRLLSDNPKIKIILWSCTKEYYFNQFIEVLERYGIKIDYCNENPEVTVEKSDPDSLSFSKKLYYNIGIDDKFGFEPEIDWKEIYKYLKQNGKIKNN